MPFLSLKQQCQSTEEILNVLMDIGEVITKAICCSLQRLADEY